MWKLSVQRISPKTLYCFRPVVKMRIGSLVLQPEFGRRAEKASIMCVVLSLFLILSSFGCQSERRPSRYLIPEGYVGWVKVRYSVQGAPALPFEGDHYLMHVPST